MLTCIYIPSICYYKWVMTGQLKKIRSDGGGAPSFFDLNPDIKEALRQRAAADGVTMVRLLERLIEEGLARPALPSRVDAERGTTVARHRAIDQMIAGARDLTDEDE